MEHFPDPPTHGRTKNTIKANPSVAPNEVVGTHGAKTS